MTDFDRQLQLARQRGEQTVTSDPARARDVGFHPDPRTLAIAFANGCELRVPVDSVKLLQDAPPELLADVAIAPSLVGLRWDALDVDLSIPDLLLDCFGVEARTQLEARMTTTIEYKGYVGAISIDEETGFLCASTIGMRGGASAMAETFSQLKAEFSISIDEYLEDCAERGVTPERSFSGEFQLQIEPETHRLALEAAQMGNQSLNAFVSEAIREKINCLGSSTQSLEDAPLKAVSKQTSSARQLQEAAIASPDS